VVGVLLLLLGRRRVLVKRPQRATSKYMMVWRMMIGMLMLPCGVVRMD